MGLPPLRDDCEPTLLLRLSPTRSPRFDASLMGLSPLKYDCIPTMLMGLSLTQSPANVHCSGYGIIPIRSRLQTHSAAGIVPTLSPEFTAPLMGLSPLGDDCEPTLMMGLFPTQSPTEFAAPLMGLSPLGDDCGSTPLLGSPPLGVQSLQVSMM